ncbi:hypothetical protein KI387_014977, partial [Taxus chinensis]
LRRSGKSCRFRWMNHLRPNINHGDISPDEEELIIRLHRLLGNRWSLIAGRLPGRTDNQIKNYWNTHLSTKSSSKQLNPQNCEHRKHEKLAKTSCTPIPSRIKAQKLSQSRAPSFEHYSSIFPEEYTRTTTAPVGMFPLPELKLSSPELDWSNNFNLDSHIIDFLDHDFPGIFSCELRCSLPEENQFLGSSC